jgi:hypothetical protein
VTVGESGLAGISILILALVSVLGQLAYVVQMPLDDVHAALIDLEDFTNHSISPGCTQSSMEEEEEAAI